ncbi:MAG TPA: peptidoglycan-binding protein [Candidatus Omnitrophota bacterium]|nr:peptidoglycan-binding protein [Candidatus Omnitrophota bacterium]HRZ15616.1 peptidoglycan-binding protein [Candidatus Omnitrophota bacterium]
MVHKYLGLGASGLVCLFLLAGCATTSNQRSENESLRNQVTTLEQQLQQKDAEIDSLRKALSKTTEEKFDAMRGERAGGSMAVPSVKQIQTALKNAGYDPGAADGRMGKNTRTAIRQFQKDNGLTSDGKVGRKTWSLLEPYLNKE